MKQIRILIGSPAQQKPEVFKEYLKSLDRLILPSGVEVDRLFIINDCPELIPLLKSDEYMIINTGDKYECNDQTHIWTYENLYKMCKLRNALINSALDGEFDALLMVDTDLILHEMTLAQLLGTQKDICAEIFWTLDAPNGVPREWPNCWDIDQCGYLPGSLEKWRVPGVYRVGGTGACILISRQAMLDGVNYSPIPPIQRAIVGEDRYACIRAYCLNYVVYVDTHYPARHLYRTIDYQQYMEETYHTGN